MNKEASFDQLRNLAIGTVEFVSPAEIKVLLDINAPQSTAINTGVPTLFPKINGFVLIPNEAGALVGIISWMGVEYSQYPKRKGLKDFDVIDLPYPLRKISLSPLGILKSSRDEKYEFERGVFSFPSVGDMVVMPTQRQLQSIVENRDERARIEIGTSPLAANTPIKVDPDKLFGRHLAVLGNTGSGKSCSVAGLIRWSLEAARKERDSHANARFIILDPNGEYSSTFDDLGTNIRKFRVRLDAIEDKFHQLRVPAWMWNSYEWSAVTQARGGTQRPVLRRALRELRNGSMDSISDENLQMRRYFSSCLVSLNNILKNGPASFSDFPGKQNFGELIKTIRDDTTIFFSFLSEGDLKTEIGELLVIINDILQTHRPNASGYYPAFNRNNVTSIKESIQKLSSHIGSLDAYKGPDEDSPVPFKGEDLPNHIERLSQEQNVIQFLDFLIMRIRTMLSDTRISSVIGTEPPLNFADWLENYIGKNNAENGEITIIDLSIVPSDVTHLVIAVISRIIFEALQRYRRIMGVELPTTIVMEEAHTFIGRYNDSSEEISAEKMCCQTFERIAREGRKFGLGLLLSSQRPSELSPTVLSQCNTFLLHRIVNDKDQELVRRLIPDNLGSLLNELPVLPTRKAILLGWAAPIPILVEMKELEKEKRPASKDPEFWGVWTGRLPRKIDWKKIAKDWQNVGTKTEVSSKT